MFSEFIDFLTIGSKKLDQILILPNVLQLAGALLTLWFGIGAIISNMNRQREEFWNKYLYKRAAQHNEELTEIIETQRKIMDFAKEKYYLLSGIILIVIGYVLGTISFDFGEFNLYFLALIITLLIGIYMSFSYLFKGIITKRRLFCLAPPLGIILYISIFHFSLLTDKLKIIFAFSGSTALIILVSMFLVERMIAYEVLPFFVEPARKGFEENINGLEKVIEKYEEENKKSKMEIWKVYLEDPIRNYIIEHNYGNYEIKEIKQIEDQRKLGYYKVIVLVEIENGSLEMLFSEDDYDYKLLGVNYAGVEVIHSLH